MFTDSFIQERKGAKELINKPGRDIELAKESENLCMCEIEKKGERESEILFMCVSEREKGRERVRVCVYV